jgi:hypothetical protein
MTKEDPSAISHKSKFYVLIAGSSSINLCDSFDDNRHSFLDVVVLVFVNSRAIEKQLLQMDVPQAITFSNIIELLKAMFLTPYACFELKFFDYSVITIEFMNCFPTKFNGEIIFELLPIHHPLGHSRQLQV